MTREEAIAVLNMVEAHGSLVIEAKNMAIKALEQPCEDCVSRQAVFETIDDCNSDGLKGIFCSYDDGERFKEYINKLPSVTPKGVTVTDFADKCRECGREKVLDKIRAEIEQKRIGYPPSAEYYWAIKECLQIIDKYKGESEE